MPLPVWLDITLQCAVALIIILILYIFTLYTLNIDSLVITETEVRPREVTTLIDGFAGPSFLYDLNFNTVNPFVENFKKMPRSTNQAGGASFTYQFWIKVEDASDDKFKDLVLFLKGDKRPVNVTYYSKDLSTSTTYTQKFKLPPDAYIACPSIAFGNSYKELKIRFNTNNDVFNEVLINMNAEGEPSSRKNLLSLLPLTWTLFTFVFQDNYSLVDNAENGIKIAFYINEVPYWVESASSIPSFRNDFFKQNDGDIYFVPNIQKATEFMKVGNFKYYNYAVQPHEIKKEFMKGPPTYQATRFDQGNTIKPAFLSALNKMDVLNY